MTRKGDNDKLVKAGLAETPREADGLRKRIAESGVTVQEYIRANPTTSSFGPGATAVAEPGNTAMAAEIQALMNQEGLSYPEARVLRESLIKDGSTVQDYLASDAISRMSGQETATPLIVFRAAGNLIRLAGSKEKAAEALESFARLSTQK